MHVRVSLALVAMALGGVACAAQEQPSRLGTACQTVGHADSERPGTRPASADAVIDPGDGGTYAPKLDPSRFVDGAPNPYFPLEPGTHWVYEGVVDSHRERIELTVTMRRKSILGISAVGVRDVNYVDGELSARTTDWYASDVGGTVWYLGEETQNFEHGRPTDIEGWRAGVDGALPGVFMLADPLVGTAYRQTHQAGLLEDLAEVECVGATRLIGLGRYRDVVVIRGWSPLEPKVIELKYYAPGVGKVEETLTAGGRGGTELVEFLPARPTSSD